VTRVIKVRNVEEALHEGFWWLKTAGYEAPSRNGPVVVAPGPVMTEYARPYERVLFNHDRDANGVFHLLESIWMLAGQSNVEWLLPYNARMKEYAEVDGVIHGAYGHRWRNFFGIDQIPEIIWELRKNPTSRQCVMQMWSAKDDLAVTKRDRPCNTHIYFSIENGSLAMTVCCRSNDALWGAYGANAVHFSILQELMASGVGVPVGVYRQFSNNFHAYTDIPTVRSWLECPPPEVHAYPHDVYPLLQPTEGVDDFLCDCLSLIKDRPLDCTTEFFTSVVVPLKSCYDARRAGVPGWRADLQYVASCDWKDSFIQWADRRER
jgi:hypothetical protein